MDHMTPAQLAEMDQDHAYMSDIRNVAMHWATAAVVAAQARNDAAHLSAVRHAGAVLSSLSEEQMIRMLFYMFTNTVELIRAREYRGDMEAYLADVPPEAQEWLREFLATDGGGNCCQGGPEGHDWDTSEP